MSEIFVSLVQNKQGKETERRQELVDRRLLDIMMKTHHKRNWLEINTGPVRNWREISELDHAL